MLKLILPHLDFICIFYILIGRKVDLTFGSSKRKQKNIFLKMQSALISYPLEKMINKTNFPRLDVIHVF